VSTPPHRRRVDLWARRTGCQLKPDPLGGELAQRLTLYDHPHGPASRGRARVAQTDLMTSGKMFRDLGLPPIPPGNIDRGIDLRVDGAC